MSGDVHVRFCERLGVKLPRATHPSLSDEKIATIVAWVDSGAPRGNPADAPPPLQFTTYKEPHLFPAGTILHVVSWHDNTMKNKHNPDPTAWVGWGSRTMDEMGHGWTDIAFLTEEQYREELAKRNAKKKIATTNN